MLGRAFFADPGFRHAFPDEARREARLTWLSARLLRLVRLAGGGVDAVDDTPSAVALWMPVEQRFDEPLGLLWRAGLFASPLALGLRATRRLAAFGRATMVMHRAHVPVPHDYLLQLAVDPAHHGQGLGSTLLRAGLERADRARRPVWLETTNPRNVALYERHGFVTMERRTLPGDVTLLGMLYAGA